MSKVTWRPDGALTKAELGQCSCGECEYDATESDWLYSQGIFCKYCPECGYRLNDDGTTTKMVPVEEDTP